MFSLSPDRMYGMVTHGVLFFVLQRCFLDVCLPTYFSLLQDIFQKLQLWKLIVSGFAFSSTPELIFGLYLMYYFRVFERQIGSNKYSVSNHCRLFYFFNLWETSSSTL